MIRNGDHGLKFETVFSFHSGISCEQYGMYGKK